MRRGCPAFRSLGCSLLAGIFGVVSGVPALAGGPHHGRIRTTGVIYYVPASSGQTLIQGATPAVAVAPAVYYVPMSVNAVQPVRVATPATGGYYLVQGPGGAMMIAQMPGPAANPVAADPELQSILSDPDSSALAAHWGGDASKVKLLRARIRERLDEFIKRNAGLLPDSQLLLPALMNVAEEVAASFGYGWAFDLARPLIERVVKKLIHERAAQSPDKPADVRPNGDTPGDGGTAPSRLRITGGYIEVVPDSGVKPNVAPNLQPDKPMPDDLPSDDPAGVRKP
ncbi:MAG: hypothetical protein JWN86_3425 [Planctomycetota bacterium]|nr:hypothetical protein [Planctomycetota bacterium]